MEKEESLEGRGLPPVCRRGGNEGEKGGGSSIVLDSEELLEPPAGEAINRLRAGRPEGSRLIS